MFTAILSIAGAVLAIAAIALFIIKAWPLLVTAWDWMWSVWDAFAATIPDWLMPLVLVALAVAAVSLIVKVV